MKRRIATDILKLQQRRIINTPNPQLLDLYKLSYSLIEDMLTDIKRPFNNVCIHGRYPQLIIPKLLDHNLRYNKKKQDLNVTIVDFIRNQNMEQLVQDKIFPVREIRYLETPDIWIPEENCFDLLVTSLQTQHSNSEEDLFRKYLRTLKPDGALIGCTYAEGTLMELYWSYLMAQNQRYGGMSPKVMSFPSLGQLGSSLTTTQYKLITILAHDETLEFESFIDLLTLVQQIGESGYLRGRRKGVFKDLLLAAAGLYSNQFSIKEDQSINAKVKATLALSKIIAWKYHQNQKRPLSKGPHVGSVDFAQQLRKFGDQVQTYEIQQGVDDPKRIK